MPAVYRLEVIECEHCGEKMNIAPHRQPVAYVEREADGQRSFLIIDVDNWLLHQCVIGAADGE